MLWIENFGPWALGFNFAVGILDFGFWSLGSGLSTLGAGLWTLSFGRWTLDSGFWIPIKDCGLSALDFGI